MATLGRWLVRLLAAGMLAAVLAASALGVAVLVVTHDPDLPRIDGVADYAPPRTTRIYDRHEVLIGELARERRTVVPLEQIPLVLVRAVVAAEDADFYQHRGLDYFGMLRAFFVNLRAGHFVQGGSTITQQVVKTFFLTPKRTLRRKMQEVVLARRLEQQFSKNDILYLYLNQIYFGHGRYGVEEACQFYFGHGVEKVTLAEAALLAGLPQAPEAITPMRHPDRAKRRQVYVLDQMERAGVVDPEAARAARDAELPIREVAPSTHSAPEIVGYVQALLEARFGAERIPYLGARIVTTLDANIQDAARRALEQGLRDLDDRQGYRKPLRHLAGKALERHLALQRNNMGPTWEAVVIDAGAVSHHATVDLGAKKATLDMSLEHRYSLANTLRVGDVLRVRLAPERGSDAVALEQGPQGAVVVLEPTSGQVRALVGGYGFSVGAFNRALHAQRQPGSAFKPIFFAAAIESGAFTAASVLVDSPEVFANWRPQNYQQETARGPVRLRTALADSINTVAVKVLETIGVEAAITMARRLGIASAIGRNLSLALGSSAVTPIEMASAFSVFAADGKRVPPSFILSVNGQPERRPAARSVLSEDVAYVMTDLLRSVIDEGTAKSARRLGRPAAGKTGTSDANRDAWFVGFTRDLVAAVWVGFDDPRSLGKGETGGRAAVPIWTDLMADAHAGKALQPFRQPSGIVVVPIDPQSGLRAAPGADNSIQEVFVAGTEPTEPAVAPGEVDRETFLLDQMKGVNP